MSGSIFSKEGCSEIANSIYFEKQQRLMCALHSLNNLIGEKIASFDALVAIAEQNIIDRYTSKKNPRISLETYQSKIRPGMYDCKDGFFNPDLVKLFINGLTEYSLKTIRSKIINEKDIVNHAKRNEKVLGYLLGTTKYDPKVHIKYNHAIALRIFRNPDNSNDLCVILLDSERSRPTVLTEKSGLFSGDNKIYSINHINGLKLKDDEVLQKQAEHIVIDLVSSENSPLTDAIIKPISKSPRLMESISESYRSRELDSVDIDLT